jgi:hypothetical protein
VEQSRIAQEEYVQKHEPWPLRPLLVFLGLLAAILACLRFRLTESEKLVAWRLAVIRGPSIALALTLLAIFVIDMLG